MTKKAFDVDAFRRALLAWYDANRRDLAWRRTDDPYEVWVSEVMLQQTQVSRVTEYWPRFLERFPTLSALAEASLDDVLAAWSGLGYYRRARSLHAAARVLVDRFDGKVPESAHELRELPGMGEYTCAAVASIAFGEDVAVVDANVVRVLARLTALAADPSRGEARRAIRSEATRLLDASRPGDFNQAMMELGALVCTPAAPRCDACPVAAGCVALERGDPEGYPISSGATGTVELREVVVVAIREGEVLLVRGGHERGWWEGLWTLPRSPLSETDDPREIARSIAVDRLGLGCESLEGPTEATYGVTKHRVTMSAFLARGTSGSCDGDAGKTVDFRWVAIPDLDRVGIPAPDRRAIEELAGGETSSAPSTTLAAVELEGPAGHSPST